MKTVKDLITELQQFPLDSVVALASDAEGNSYYDIDEVCGEYYSVPDEGDFDLLIPETDIEEDEEVGQMTPTVVIWPL